MPPKKTTDKKLSEEQGGLSRTAISKSAALAAAAMQGAEPWQRYLVFSCYSISGLGILVIGMPPYETNKQLWASGISGSLIFLAMMFVLWHYRKLIGSRVPGPNGNGLPLLPTPPASAEKPSTPEIPLLVHNAIRETLANARKVAFDFLNALNSSLLDEHVRGNIFFPEYGPSGNRDDYVLKIRPGLHINMNSEPEIAIVLKPKQGATGQTFYSGVPRVARRLDDDSVGGWEETHRITPELEKVLNKDLQWVISMPLRGDGGRCIGVMNIDGLVYEFKNDQLQDCMKKLTSYPFIIDGFIRR